MVKLTETLVLARSRASDIENVRKLNCWGSDLTDVSILRRVPNIQVVSLSVNKISTLVDFSFCTNLEELYIRKNDIPRISEINHLKKLPKLTKLWLADNPCADCDKYRLTVLRTLPNLQKLDNITVTPEEVNAALDEPLPDLSPRDSGGPGGAGDTAGGGEEGSRPVNGATGEGSKEEEQTGAAAADVLTPLRSDSPTEVEEKCKQSPVMISWDETNKIRQQLGLKPLAVEKVTQMKPRTSNSAKTRNANLLSAALSLVKELDAESLEIVGDAVRNRLDCL